MMKPHFRFEHGAWAAYDHRNDTNPRINFVGAIDDAYEVYWAARMSWYNYLKDFNTETKKTLTGRAFLPAKQVAHNK